MQRLEHARNSSSTPKGLPWGPVPIRLQVALAACGAKCRPQGVGMAGLRRGVQWRVGHGASRARPVVDSSGVGSRDGADQVRSAQDQRSAVV